MPLRGATIMQDNDRDLLPEGLGDRLPQQAEASQRVRRAVLDAMAAHGYERVETPTIEFEKSMASRMAGVQVRRMFRFVDPVSLRTLALRSDITMQVGRIAATSLGTAPRPRSEEHTSELQSLMRISYAVFCLKKK